MATSPRSELVIHSITEFARLDGKWYWRTDTAQEHDVAHGDTPFDSLQDAVVAFFKHEGVDPTVAVHPTEAHYSELQKSTEDSYHIRHYAFGAPDPIQKVHS